MVYIILQLDHILYLLLSALILFFKLISFPFRTPDEFEFFVIRG